MDNTHPNTKLSDALGLETMQPAARDAFLAQLGSVIIDAAVGRLLLSLSEDEVTELESYLSTTEDDNDLFEYLLKTYPNFEKLLQEEATALQTEAEQIVS